ncbi:MAG: hypothetical protein V8S34_09155 [Lawsonibacter sp.]
MLCAAALLLWLHHRAGLSPYAGQPSGQFLCTADADRYPLDTDQITLRVSNVGDYEGELDKPRLEVQKNGAWYFVPPTDQTGETAQPAVRLSRHFCRVDSSLTPYRAKLAPGQYRAVFGLHGSREFFSWEFWLEAPA